MGGERKPYVPPKLRPITDPKDIARIDRAIIADLRAKLDTTQAVLAAVRLECDNLEAEVRRLTESLDAARRGREAR